MSISYKVTRISDLSWLISKLDDFDIEDYYVFYDIIRSKWVCSCLFAILTCGGRCKHVRMAKENMLTGVEEILA